MSMNQSTPVRYSWYTTMVRGFSLVEMLVYISIVVLVTAASVSVLLSLGGVVQQYQAEQSLLRSNISMAEQLLLDIRAASSVNIAASVLYDPEGSLVLVTDAGPVSYQLVAGVIERQDSAGTTVVQQTNVIVDRFEVQVVSSSRSDFVSIALDTAVSTRQSTSTRSYTIGALTRAAYD